MTININVFSNHSELSRAAAQAIVDQVKEKPNALLCLAAGNTPLETFRYLVEASKAGECSFDQCRFVGLDEWVGLGVNNEGSCEHTLFQHLFEPLGVEPSRIRFFNAETADLEEECRLVNLYLEEHGPVDLMLLGLGVNGHLGFNEPGTAFNSRCHVVKLDPSTREVGRKYFGGTRTPEMGITLGLGDVLDSQTVFLLASGPAKATAIKTVVQGNVTESVPATVLQNHGNCGIYLDEAAAMGLSPR